MAARFMQSLGGLTLAIPILTSCAAQQPAADANGTTSQQAQLGSALKPEPTRVLDRAAGNRLINNSGITLQWISWDSPGSATIREGADGIWTINASQKARGNEAGALYVSGTIREIGADYFIMDGTVKITDTPDAGRDCTKPGESRFAVTQNRKYWRLREFEWCDGLTDYIDIYF